jgi:hypothetical protein
MSDVTHGEPGAVEEQTMEQDQPEGEAAHSANRPPTAEEEAAAEQNELGPEVAEHEREMGRIGAQVKGEGRID